MKVNYMGVDINVEIIGGFKINSKEYAVCSYVDSNENYKIVLVQVDRKNNNIEIKDIPKEDMEIVLSKYREIEKTLLGGDDDE